MNQAITDSIQLRKMGNTYIACADLIERSAGIIQGGNSATQPVAVKRAHSAETIKKMRLAAKRRQKNKLAQVHTLAKAA